jgi:uncharacterized protein with PQ loop repeat
MSEGLLKNLLGWGGTALYVQLHRRGAILLGAAVVLLPLAAVSPRPVGVTAAVVGAAIAVPETVNVVWEPPRALAGVSFGLWLLVGVNAVVWLIYGILVHHPILGAAGMLQLPCSVIICSRVLRERAEEREQSRGRRPRSAGAAHPRRDSTASYPTPEPRTPELTRQGSRGRRA